MEDESSAVEINITRLLLSAIKTNNEIKINIQDYLDENLETYKMMLSLDDELNQFILHLEEAKDES